MLLQLYPTNSMQQKQGIYRHMDVRMKRIYLLFLTAMVGVGCSSENDSLDILPSSPDVPGTVQESDIAPTSSVDLLNSEQDSGLTPPSPIDVGFWRSTDDRLVLYNYSTERGDSGDYSSILELNRSQMNAQTLDLLESVRLNIFSLDSFFRQRIIRDDDSVLFEANELMYPDCQTGIATDTVFYVAVSSGSEGEPVSVVSSNACGEVNLFPPSELDGVVNPHDILTSVPLVASQ